MRLLRSVAALGAVLALLSLGLPASAGASSEFTACIAPTRTGDYCTSGDTYLAGSVLWLRGKTQASNAGMLAKVLVKPPGTGEWAKAGSTQVSDKGKVAWRWKTDAADANPARYRLRFKIPGYGASAVATVLLIAGE